MMKKGNLQLTFQTLWNHSNQWYTWLKYNFFLNMQQSDKVFILCGYIFVLYIHVLVKNSLAVCLRSNKSGTGCYDTTYPA